MTKLISNRTKVSLLVGSMALCGLTLLPGSISAASKTADTTITGVIDSTISVTSDSANVNLNVTPSADGAVTTAKNSISVTTNNAGGYKLSIAGAADSTDLAKDGDTTNKIAASTGTLDTPAKLTANTWGYRVDGAGTFTGESSDQTSATAEDVDMDFAGVQAGKEDVIKTTSAPASDDKTTVYYGIDATSAMPSGSYSGHVTYTAVSN